MSEFMTKRASLRTVVSVLGGILFAISNSHVSCVSGGDEDSEIPPIRAEVQEFLQRPEVYFQDKGHVALCQAITVGDLIAVQKLCSDKTIISAQGKNGVTPLFWAYLSRQFAIFEFLLRSGADPDVSVSIPRDDAPVERLFPFDTGDSVFFMAVKNATSSKWIMLLLQVSPKRQLMQPIVKRDLLHEFLYLVPGNATHTEDVMKAICRYGVDLNMADETGHTPLLIAVHRSQYRFASVLLNEGASASCYNAEHYQLIHDIARQYKFTMLNFATVPGSLEQWNASPKKKDWDEMLGILRKQGFSLTEALKDLERVDAEGSSSDYMRQRRIRREDRFSCESGREFRESLEDDPDFEDPLGEIMPRDCMAAPVN